MTAKDANGFGFNDPADPIRPIDLNFRMPQCYPAYTYDPGPLPQADEPDFVTKDPSSRPAANLFRQL